MKRMLIILIIVIGLGAWMSLSRAQRLAPAAPATSDKLAAAVALLEAGQPREARALLATVGTNSPAYGLARAWDALCRYELCRTGASNYLWFLAVFKSPALTNAVLPPALREELAFTEIDALYQCRQFKQPGLVEKVGAFQQRYPGSADLAAVVEYGRAGQFERGLEQLYEASWAEPGEYPQLWTNGVAELERFLALGGGGAGREYKYLSERSPATELAVAVLLAGGEPERLGEVRGADAALQERLGLMRVGSQQKRHPEQLERNLDLLAEWVAELERTAASPQRRQVEQGLAHLAFRTGEALHKAAKQLPAEETRAPRAAAGEYFAVARAVQERLVATLPPGADPIDELRAFQMGRLTSLWWEEKDAQMMGEAAVLRTNSAAGSPNWLLARVYEGIGLTRQTPPQADAAAAVFEEVLGWGFAPDKGKHRGAHDSAVLAAARWRMYLALLAGDRKRALELIQMVELSQLAQVKSVQQARAKFLQDYASVVAWAEATN